MRWSSAHPRAERATYVQQYWRSLGGVYRRSGERREVPSSYSSTPACCTGPAQDGPLRPLWLGNQRRGR
eukprot:9437491-Alexandrium_andersonii.AAC.1